MISVGRSRTWAAGVLPVLLVLAVALAATSSSTAIYGYDRASNSAPTHLSTVWHSTAHAGSDHARSRSIPAMSSTLGAPDRIGSTRQLVPSPASSASVVAAEGPAGISDETIIARGGTKPLPGEGEVFSGSQGQSVEEAAQGLKHGQFRWTTAGDIRAAGGTVEPLPEFDPGVGATNYQHVNVCLGGGACEWSELDANPVSKAERFGGKDYPFYDGYREWGP